METQNMLNMLTLHFLPSFISLLVWKGFYIRQKYNFCILKTEKQAQPRWEKVMQK